MKHLHDLFVGHERVERREIDIRRQRVDDEGFFGRCHLRDAEQRVVGGLAQEFRVDGDEGVGSHPLARGGKLRRRGDRVR
jgi:hypothetical protein